MRILISALIKIRGMQAVKALGYSNEEITWYPKGSQEGKCRNMKKKVS